MKDRTIAVIIPDRVVIVDGEGYRCIASEPSNLHAMHWLPQRDPPGVAEYKDGSGGSFDDFSHIAPYVEMWRKAKAHHEAELKREEERAAREVQEIEAERKRYLDALDQRREMENALNVLADTDHEVIKAMEERLADMGALPSEFVAKRRVMRAKVLSERAKLAKTVNPS